MKGDDSISPFISIYNMNHLIKELQYAKELHRKAMEQDKGILKQKDFVIAVLKKKNPSKKDLEIATGYIKFWKETHENWIELIKLNKKWIKYGGTITWQKKWMRIYDKILFNLNETKNSETKQLL